MPKRLTVRYLNGDKEVYENVQINTFNTTNNIPYCMFTDSNSICHKIVGNVSFTVDQIPNNLDQEHVKWKNG